MTGAIWKTLNIQVKVILNCTRAHCYYNWTPLYRHPLLSRVPLSILRFGHLVIMDSFLHVIVHKERSYFFSKFNPLNMDNCFLPNEHILMESLPPLSEILYFQMCAVNINRSFLKVKKIYMYISRNVSWQHVNVHWIGWIVNNFE